MILTPYGKPFYVITGGGDRGQAMFVDGSAISDADIRELTGRTRVQILGLMRTHGLSLEEAFHMPLPRGGERLQRSEVEAHRSVWKAFRENPPPPSPNGADAAPEPTVAQETRFHDVVVRVEAVSPDRIIAALDALADRLDALEAKLDHLISLWEPK